jgi:hypothetical protein
MAQLFLMGKVAAIWTAQQEHVGILRHIRLQLLFDSEVEPDGAPMEPALAGAQAGLGTRSDARPWSLRGPPGAQSPQAGSMLTSPGLALQGRYVVKGGHLVFEAPDVPSSTAGSTLIGTTEVRPA